MGDVAVSSGPSFVFFFYQILKLHLTAVWSVTDSLCHQKFFVFYLQSLYFETRRLYSIYCFLPTVFALEQKDISSLLRTS